MNSIKDLLIELGYNVSNSSPTHYRCNPLYRNSSSSSVLAIDKKSGEFYDFARNNGGSLEELIRLTLNFEDISELESWLKNKNYQINEAPTKPILKMPKIFEEIFVLPHDYWKEKNISKNTLNYLNAKGIAHAGPMRNRYCFPIPNETGELLGYAGRLVTGDKPDETGKIGKWKIIGAKKNFIYPYYYNYLEIKKANEVIILESIGDFLALFESGYKHGLVLFGIKISSAIITKLIEINPSRIIIATNNDQENHSAGNLAAQEIENKLSNFFDKEKLINGCPLFHKDLMNLYGQEGSTGIKEWYSGLFL